MQRQIRTSAKAVVIRDNKLLVLAMRDEDGLFYILPGGGQHESESLPEAAMREVAEETGLQVAADELLFAIEGIHGEDFHRVDLVFACRELGRSTAEHQGDHNQVGIAWLDLDNLNRAPLYPSKLRRPIMNYHQGKAYPRYLGNEEIGDPEITD